MLIDRQPPAADLAAGRGFVNRERGLVRSKHEQSFVVSEQTGLTFAEQSRMRFHFAPPSDSAGRGIDDDQVVRGLIDTIARSHRSDAQEFSALSQRSKRRLPSRLRLIVTQQREPQHSPRPADREEMIHGGWRSRLYSRRKKTIQLRQHSRDDAGIAIDDLPTWFLQRLEQRLRLEEMHPDSRANERSVTDVAVAEAFGQSQFAGSCSIF